MVSRDKSMPFAFRGRAGLGVVIPLVLVIAWMAPARPARAQGGAPSFFGTTEVRRDNLAPFPKWTGAMARYFEERGKQPGACQEDKFNQCHWQAWQKLLAESRAKPPLQQLEQINKFLNQYRYITDPINWGVDDYWESPSQFLARYGDCEDYAIAKFLSLRALGWDNDRLRVVVLQDLNLKIPHAVLVAQVDGKYFVLDNQIPQVVEASTIRHYRPIFSVNETAWWLHRQ